MTEQAWISEVGPWLFLLGYFFYKEVWPLIRDYLKPGAAKIRRKAESEIAERVFKAFEGNTIALVGLQHTLAQVVETISELADGQHDINEQIAEIYGYLQKPRPQRKHSQPKENPV